MGSGEDTSRPALEGRGEGGHGALSGLRRRGHPQVFHLQGGENEVGDQSFLQATECWELVSCPVGLTLLVDSKSQGSSPHLFPLIIQKERRGDSLYTGL